MCVSASPAELGGTRAYTWHTLGHPDPQRPSWHVTAYQNFARNLGADPNCMLLHFPGSNLNLVRGPELTRFLMQDVTSYLPELIPTPTFRGASSSKTVVEDYGDYTVILAESAAHILEALEQVPEHRRPKRSTKLEALVEWYHTYYPDYAFVLACFAEGATPQHPIVVEYVPNNDDVLFIPGLDCHTGEIPEVGVMMQRDFWVAFGSELHQQATGDIRYSDSCTKGAYWAPKSVVGFRDNAEGPNKDYVVPLLSVEEGLNGRELLDVLVS